VRVSGDPTEPLRTMPLPAKIEDEKKVNVAFPRSKELEDRIVEYAMELDNYGVQSAVRAQDYVKTFMRANALLNNRAKVTKSDLYPYDPPAIPQQYGSDGNRKPRPSTHQE